MKKFRLSAFADEASAEIDGQIEAMLANGIELLEIRGVDGANISKITGEKAKEVKSKLDAKGLGVWSIGSPSGKIGIKDDFAPHLDEFKHMLELAGILGAERFRLFSFYGYDGSDSARDTVLERLNVFLSEAKDSGVTLCHENEKGIYGEKADACAVIHKAIPEIKAVFDPANFVQAGQGTKEAWEMLAPYVDYMHIKDAVSGGKVVPAGKGDGELQFLLEKFGASGGGVLTLEPHLSVFKGFEELENGEKTEMGEFQYPSQRAAFNAATDALKELIG